MYDYCLDDGGISKVGAGDEEMDDTTSGSEVEFSVSALSISLFHASILGVLFLDFKV